jgi:tetratricopeptide (TPR) repeat protein
VRAAASSPPSRPVAVAAAPALVPGVSDVFGLRESGAARADRAYSLGRYEEALRRFEAALGEPGQDEGLLLFDLGGAAWRLGRHADALCFWRRAALRLPRDRELAFNLQFAERQLELDAPAPAPLDLLAAFTRVEKTAAGAVLAVAALVGTVFARRRRLARVLLAALAILGLALAAHGLGWLAPAPRGVVLAGEIGLRAEPHRETAVSLRLRAGESVRIEESSDRWALIVHPRGSGWTERAGIGIVD